jgi:ribosomal protein L37AE/L43A
LIRRNVEPGKIGYATPMLLGFNAPVCPMCGEPMRLRRVVRRSARDTVEVWQCRRCGDEAGGALGALIAASRSAGTGEPIGRRLRSDIMTRSARQRLLDEAEQAVRHCRRHQERQLTLIEKRERIGHDASEARALLKTLHQLQVEHEANRDRIVAELAEQV